MDGMFVLVLQLFFCHLKHAITDYIISVQDKSTTFRSTILNVLEIF